jgi:hypothetical protein
LFSSSFLQIITRDHPCRSRPFERNPGLREE